MAFQQRDNSGALFRSEDRKSDKHPSHTGSCTIEGRSYFVDAWVNETKDGKKYFSLRFNPKLARDHAGAPANPPAQTRQGSPEFDDNIPF